MTGGGTGAGGRSAIPRASQRLRSVAAIAVAVLALADCDDGDTPPAAEESPAAADGETDATTDPPATDGGTADTGDDGEEPVALPEVSVLAPDEVDDEAADGTLDAAIAAAAGGVPDGWVVAVVPDAELGPFVLGTPAGVTVWRVGEDLAALRDAVTDDVWLRYWEPVLTAAGEAADTSSLRAVVVLPPVAGDGAEVHLTINATPQQDLPVDDPAAVAARFAETFGDQGLTVEDATTAEAGDGEVAALTLTTPEDEFDDGVPRRLRQWFYPEVDSPVLWSVTCEAPAPATATVDEVCPAVLASFRTPPR